MINKINKSESGCWDISSNKYLYVEPSAQNLIDSFRQNSSDKSEAGGLILGRFAGDHIHILEVTTPYPKDKRSRFRFERRDKRHIIYAGKLYEKSAGKINILGEWHTHPEEKPSPSPLDKGEWIKLVKLRESLPTIFIVCGIDDWWVGTTM